MDRENSEPGLEDRTREGGSTQNAAGILIGAGGGKVLETARTAAADLKLPVVTVRPLQRACTTDIAVMLWIPLASARSRSRTIPVPAVGLFPKKKKTAMCQIFKQMIVFLSPLKLNRELVLAA